MPVFFQYNIKHSTRLIVWHLQETEDFFLSKINIKSFITHPYKRLQHICGRFLLKYLFDDFPDEEIILDHSGKPVLLKKQYCFSISHTNEYVSVMVSKECEVGVDIESIQYRGLKIVSKFLSKDEQRNLYVTTELSATICWAIKEAIYKCYNNLSLNFKNDIHIINLYKKEELSEAEVKLSKQAILVKVSYKVLSNVVLAWVVK